MRKGPAPKPAAVRRYPPTRTGRIVLPRAGYAGPIPAWNAVWGEPTEQQLRRWNELWRTPAATAWCVEPSAIVTLVALEERCSQPRASGQHIAELRHQRNELGLLPEGAAKLGMVVEDEPDQPDQAASVSPVRRLRAIDEGIS